MSGDEFLVLIISGAIALIGWGRWIGRFLCIPSLGPRLTDQKWLMLIPAGCLAGLFPVLRLLASFDVRSSAMYLFFYMVLGAAWMALFRALYPLLGLNWIDDVVDRRNTAATAALTGALAGTLACYAGANVGDGPGWWCIFVAGGWAIATWFGCWFLAEKTGKFAESITVERDTAAGIRLGALLLAIGIICGRGAAGDWTSAEHTAIEFLVAWPAVPLVLVAGIVERWLTLPDDFGIRKPGSVPAALILGMLWLLAALTILHFSPPLPKNPQYGMKTEWSRHNV
jgi:uncharacterized membrane protein YjfL (UPF0719 family)